jgi:hypothetical protein
VGLPYELFNGRGGVRVAVGSRSERGDIKKSEIKPMIKPREVKLSQPSHALPCGGANAIRHPMQTRTHPGSQSVPSSWRPQPGAPKGEKNGNYSNGDWTVEAIEERKWLRHQIKTNANLG